MLTCVCQPKAQAEVAHEHLCVEAEHNTEYNVVKSISTNLIS